VLRPQPLPDSTTSDRLRCHLPLYFAGFDRRARLLQSSGRSSHRLARCSSTAVGQASEGVSWLTKAISLFRAAGAVLGTSDQLAYLAQAYARLGRPAEGLRTLADAPQFIEATGERYFEAEVYRVQGDLLTATGDHAAAEQSYRRALAVAGHQNAKTLELRAATSLARLWRDQGKRTEAHELLAPVYGWFTEGFDTLDLKEAKALLEELAA